LLENLDEYLKEIKLGEDAQRITEDYFLAKIKGKKGSIKGFLLNQSIFAGMGNLYADQVCFQTRVHPESVCDKISKKKQKEIFSTMQEVLKSAIAKSIDYKSNDFDEQFSWRTEGAKAPNKRSKVCSRKIAGRTTYFAKGWQKLYK